MSFVLSHLRILLSNINPHVSEILFGSVTSMVVGETLKGSEITGSNTADAIIKVAVPIITGILIPICQEIIRERKNKHKNRKL